MRGAASDHMFQKGQKRQVQHVIAFAHPFILAVRCKEELLQVIATDGYEIGQLEKLIRRIGEAGRFQHGTDFQLGGHGVAQTSLAVNLAQHMAPRLLELAEFADEGEHHLQGPPICGAQQRLHLHAQYAGLVQTDADGPPAHRGVWLVIRLHVGQHLVRANVEGAKRHRAALGGIHDAGIQTGQFRALRHLVADQKLQFGTEQTDTHRP